MNISDLHDTTLLRIDCEWSKGIVVISLVSEDHSPTQIRIVATEVSFLLCPRKYPWGRSDFVNKAKIVNQVGGSERLAVEMQSGDVIEVEAARIEIVENPTPLAWDSE
jgi:hypothetical protein